MENNKYMIGEASELTGATTKQIRGWDRFLGDVGRQKAGAMRYRVYNDKQIKIIKMIKENLDKGYKLKVAVEKVLGAESA